MWCEGSKGATGSRGDRFNAAGPPGRRTSRTNESNAASVVRWPPNGEACARACNLGDIWHLGVEGSVTNSAVLAAEKMPLKGKAALDWYVGSRHGHI